MNIEVLDKPLASRRRRAPITTIVLHSTAGGSATSSIAWLRKIGLSYHYVIERDGTIYKCVPTGREAFHAGRSVGPSGSGVNRYSIGIAFANYNNGEALTDAQLQAHRELVNTLWGVIPTIRYITTHRICSWKRKTDPKGYDPREHFLFTRLWRAGDHQPWAG
jgi:N-acetylmuramoyl-L-alanine amidase